jgi:hypothetical protein
MNKEDLYALLGLGIGGLGGYFGQRALDKRRAGNQLSLEDQERLAKISAGIDPDGLIYLLVIKNLKKKDLVLLTLLKN